MWSTKLSWSSVMTPRLLVDFVGTIAKDPRLMLMLCCAVLCGRFGWEDHNFCLGQIDLKSQAEMCDATVESSG